MDEDFQKKKSLGARGRVCQFLLMALTGPCNNFLIIFFGRKKIYFFSPDRDFNKKIHIFCARPGFLQKKVVKKSTFCGKVPKKSSKRALFVKKSSKSRRKEHFLGKSSQKVVEKSTFCEKVPKKSSKRALFVKKSPKSLQKNFFL